MTCPNCGEAFDGERCPNCGWTASRTGSRIAAVFVLILLVLPLGAVGACTVVMGVEHPSGPGAASALGFALPFGGIIAFFFVAALLWFLSLWRG